MFCRVQRHCDAVGFGKARRPHPPSEQDFFGGDHAFVGLHANHASRLSENARGGGVFKYLSALLTRALRHRKTHIKRVYLSV